MGKKKSSNSSSARMKNSAPATSPDSASPVPAAVSPNVNATSTGGTPREELAACTTGNHQVPTSSASAKKTIDQVKIGSQPVDLGGKNSNSAKGSIGNTWASLFKNNRSSASGATLTQVFDGVEMEGIHFDSDEIADDSQVSRSLIGFFSPKFPGMDAIKQMTETWKHKCNIFRHASTWTVFAFPSKEEALDVLEAGPYQIFGNVLHLKAMPKLFNFSREAQQFVPIWIQLHNLPLEFWTPRLLSKLCTFIGQPLHTDQLTRTRERISFARCLVQISVNVDLPTILTLHLPDGTILEQPVLYENKPISCTKCKRIGHDESACRDTGILKLYVMKKPNQKQVKKKVNAATAPIDTWVQVGKEKEKDTINDKPMDVPEEDQEEDGSEDDYSENSGNEENGTEEENEEENETEDEDKEENSEEESDDGEPEEEAEDREPPVVVVLKDTAPTPASSPLPSAPSSSPLILKGDRSPPRVPPPGYDIQVDENGGWELFPIWPTVQDAASLPRVTRSRKKK